MDIRKATTEDAQEIAQVHTLSWQTTYDGIFPASFLNTISVSKKASSFAQEIEKGERILHCVLQDDHYVGMFMLQYHDTFCEIVALYLLEQYQNMGIGRKIIQFIKDLCENQDLKQISLWVLQENLSAIAFYEKVGFVKTVTQKSVIISDISVKETRFNLLLE